MFEFYTFGGGEIIWQLLNGIVLVVGDDEYTSLIRLAGMFGIVGVAILSAFTMRFEIMYRWLLAFAFIWFGLLVPKATVIINDSLDPTQNRVVDNVPIGVAMPFSFATRIRYVITTRMENAFTVPGDLTYERTGLVIGARLLSNADQFRIGDFTTRQWFGNFFFECFVMQSEMPNSTIDQKTFFSSNAPWQYIKDEVAQGSQALWYTRPENSKQVVKNCADDIPVLDSALTAAIEKSYPMLSGITKYTKGAALPVDWFMEVFGKVATGYLNSADPVDEMIKKIFIVQELTAELETINKRIDPLATGPEIGMALARVQTSNVRTLSFAQAAEQVPVLRHVIEGVLIVLFIFLIPMAMMPNAWKGLVMYLKAIIWLQLWDPMYAILNLWMSSAAVWKMERIVQLQTEFDPISLMGVPMISDFAVTSVNLAQGMAIAIPMLAWVVASGFTNFGLTTLASQQLQPMQRAAEQGATMATTENISLGNRSIDNESMHNVNNFGYNEMLRFEGRAAQITNSTGTSMDVAPSGHIGAMRAAQSSTAFNASINEAHSQAINNQSQKVFTFSDAIESRASSSVFNSLSETDANSIRTLDSVIQSNATSNTDGLSTTNAHGDRSSMTNSAEDTHTAQATGSAHSGISVQAGLGRKNGAHGGENEESAMGGLKGVVGKIMRALDVAGVSTNLSATNETSESERVANSTKGATVEELNTSINALSDEKNVDALTKNHGMTKEQVSNVLGTLTRAREAAVAESNKFANSLGISNSIADSSRVDKIVSANVAGMMHEISPQLNKQLVEAHEKGDVNEGIALMKGYLDGQFGKHKPQGYNELEAKLNDEKTEAFNNEKQLREEQYNNNLTADAKNHQRDVRAKTNVDQFESSTNQHSQRTENVNQNTSSVKNQNSQGLADMKGRVNKSTDSFEDKQFEMKLKNGMNSKIEALVEKGVYETVGFGLNIIEKNPFTQLAASMVSGQLGGDSIKKIAGGLIDTVAEAYPEKFDSKTLNSLRDPEGNIDLKSEAFKHNWGTVMDVTQQHGSDNVKELTRAVSKSVGGSGW